MVAPFVNYPLKSGTRQLREHELRYFGLANGSNSNRVAEPKPHSKPSVAAVRRFYEVRSKKETNDNYDRTKYESSEDDIPLDSIIDHEVDQDLHKNNTFNGSSLDITEVTPERRLEMSPQRDKHQDQEILDELTRASEEILNVNNFIK